MTLVLGIAGIAVAWIAAVVLYNHGWSLPVLIGALVVALWALSKERVL